MLLLFLLLPPASHPPELLTGYASGYAPGVFEGVVRWRLDTGVWRVRPRWDWYYQAHGYIATTDCAKVGSMATLYDPNGKSYRVLVGDCSGHVETTAWMLDNNIVVELDGRLWDLLTAEHGRPLAVSLRYD